MLNRPTAKNHYRCRGPKIRRARCYDQWLLQLKGWCYPRAKLSVDISLLHVFRFAIYVLLCGWKCPFFQIWLVFLTLAQNFLVESFLWKFILPFPWNPYFKTDGTSLLILILVQINTYSFWKNDSIKNFRQMMLTTGLLSLENI